MNALQRSALTMRRTSQCSNPTANSHILGSFPDDCDYCFAVAVMVAGPPAEIASIDCALCGEQINDQARFYCTFSPDGRHVLPV